MADTNGLVITIRADLGAFIWQLRFMRLAVWFVRIPLVGRMATRVAMWAAKRVARTARVEGVA